MGIRSENCMVIVGLGMLLEDQVPVFWVGDWELVNGYDREFLKGSS